jgi:predicted outer membrane repeat protein
MKFILRSHRFCNVQTVFMLLMLCVACTAMNALAATWHVAIDGNDLTGDGSLGAPFATIQHAVDLASSGDTVSVGPGLYVGDGNRDVSLSGTALTITSKGGPEATTIDCEGGEPDQHRAMTFESAIDSTFKVVGLTLKNGFQDSAAGLVLIRPGCTPVFETCRLELGEAYHGGALYFENSGGTFRQCMFIGNTSENLGGALFAATGSDVRFESCEFYSNSSSNGYGGAIMVGIDAEAQFEDCLFSENEATWGGGLLYASGATVTFNNCTFVKSAAIWSGDVLAFTQSEVFLTNCLMHTVTAGEAIVCLGTSTVSVVCSNIYSTQYSGWFGCHLPQYGTAGNIAVDPLFVDFDSGDYRLETNSPCAPENNSCGVLLGSEEVDEGADDCGDLDGNRSVNISDAVYAINYIFASGTPPVDSHGGDVDCSGALNISDCVYLVNYIFASGSPPCAACP